MSSTTKTLSKGGYNLIDHHLDDRNWIEECEKMEEETSWGRGRVSRAHLHLFSRDYFHGVDHARRMWMCLWREKTKNWSKIRMQFRHRVRAMYLSRWSCRRILSTVETGLSYKLYCRLKSMHEDIVEEDEVEELWRMKLSKDWWDQLMQRRRKGKPHPPQTETERQRSCIVAQCEVKKG